MKAGTPQEGAGVREERGGMNIPHGPQMVLILLWIRLPAPDLRRSPSVSDRPGSRSCIADALPVAWAPALRCKKGIRLMPGNRHSESQAHQIANDAAPRSRYCCVDRRILRNAIRRSLLANLPETCHRLTVDKFLLRVQLQYVHVPFFTVPLRRCG